MDFARLSKSIILCFGGINVTITLIGCNKGNNILNFSLKLESSFFILTLKIPDSPVNWGALPKCKNAGEKKIRFLELFHKF